MTTSKPKGNDHVMDTTPRHPVRGRPGHHQRDEAWLKRSRRKSDPRPHPSLGGYREITRVHGGVSCAGSVWPARIRPDNIPRDEIMTRRCAVLITLTLLLGGCGESPTPQTSVTSPNPEIDATTEYDKGGAKPQQRPPTYQRPLPPWVRLPPGVPYPQEGVPYPRKVFPPGTATGP